MSQKLSPFGHWLSKSTAGQLVSFFVITPIGAFIPLPGVILIFIWKRLIKLPFSELGLSKPSSWIKVFLIGIPTGIFLKLFFKSVVMTLLGAEPTNTNFQFLEDNLTAALSLSLFVIVSAGFGEEVLFRGFVYTRLQKWLGESMKANLMIVTLGSVIFGHPHIYQGVHGAIHATLVGMIIGIIYYVNKRNLWLLIVLHASFDLISIYLIYHGLEEAVASFFF